MPFGEDGYFVSSPSNSPENRPGNQPDRRNETTMNATMGFALAKKVLTHLIDGAAITDEPEKDVENWRAMLAKIPPYQINEDGAIKEGMHPLLESTVACLRDEQFLHHAQRLASEWHRRRFPTRSPSDRR